MSFTTVAVKSAFLSKINWTAAITASISLAAAFGMPISEEAKVQILTITGVAGPVIISIMRTWFTSTITTAVADKL